MIEYLATVAIAWSMASLISYWHYLPKVSRKLLLLKICFKSGPFTRNVLSKYYLEELKTRNPEPDLEFCHKDKFLEKYYKTEYKTWATKKDASNDR